MIYWALGPFVRSFTPLVDPGDIYPPHICSHGCLDGLGILHPKLCEYVLNVLHLANEGTLLELLDLKS